MHAALRRYNAETKFPLAIFSFPFLITSKIEDKQGLCFNSPVFLFGDFKILCLYLSKKVNRNYYLIFIHVDLLKINLKTAILNLSLCFDLGVVFPFLFVGQNLNEESFRR